MRFHLVQKGKRHASTDEQHYRKEPISPSEEKKEEEKNVNGFKRQHKMEKRRETV